MLFQNCIELLEPLKPLKSQVLAKISRIRTAGTTEITKTAGIGTAGTTELLKIAGIGTAVIAGIAKIMESEPH